MNPHEGISQRVECTELRMRLEEIADSVIQEMFDLPEQPFTTRVDSRITAVIGRIPGDVSQRHWAIVAGATHAYHQICDVIHGRTAWTRVPRVQLESWADAVRQFEALGSEIGLTSECSIGRPTPKPIV